MELEMPNGVRTTALEEMRILADQMVCGGSWEKGRTLHALLDAAKNAGGVEELESELRAAEKDARDAERDKEYAEKTVKCVQDRLTQFEESFMRLLNTLDDEGRLKDGAFDQLHKEFRDGLADATGLLYDIA